MPQETLAQVFGSNFSQDANTFTITKSDLASTGLTASSSNTPGELFVALLLFAANTYNTTNQSSNPEVPITITASSYPTIDVRNNTNFLQQSYTVALETVLSAVTVSPNNYA